MPRWQPDASIVDQKQALATPEVQGALAAPDLPDPLGRWLGRLCLLEGVPFNYLVPDARMLPKESIRFFYVDRNWLDSLVDGAFSIGKASSRDATHHESNNAAIRSTADAAAQAARSSRLGAPAPQIAPGGIFTGLLMRSAVVSRYPGLEVKAYADTGRGTALPLLRLERLAPDVLIAIVSGVPALIDVDEPPEGLHFGAVLSDDETGPQDEPIYQIALRWLTAGQDAQGTHAPGQVLEAPDEHGAPQPKWVEVPLRDKARRVIDVRQLHDRLRDALGEQGALAGGTLSPKDFAIQLVKSAERQTFEYTGSPPPSPAPPPAAAPPAATKLSATDLVRT